ncbi:hypothetical protein FCL40_12075 [Ferrimonas sediminicola]|uniref:Uncharacterized protein n=1 Tax=Ferrimonas sediminicola TaxID=2569538 RepID=A0A4U1BBW3_9GAMM|nr:hypothetical protein [Ferrimonas sediminicola]TKB48441.1 hypothetical protein FCL40_12075 [Ferrimonas sediminicola]
MSNIVVKQEESLSLKVVHQMTNGDHRRIDLYFMLPKDMGVNPQSLDAGVYCHSAVVGRRSYYSTGLHLPLVQGRFVSLNKRTVEEFRLYLNLFAYQFAIAIETDSTELAQLKEADQFYPALSELCDIVTQLLKKFRRNEPSEPNWKHYFENADNYLSWFCEQRLLKLLSHAPRSSEYGAIIDQVVSLCRAESAYRDDRQYNSEQTKSDPNRISNKMLLLRRLIQQGVVLKEELKILGVGLQKLTTGVATGVIMLIVSSLIIKAQGVLSGLSLALVLTLAVIYAFREIFKDDLRNALWRRIQKGRPRWSRILRDTTSQSVIGRQLIWADFINNRDLPEVVDDILSRRHSQNRVDTEILHYGISSRISQKAFLTGYTTIQEQINFSLVPFARYLDRGKAKIYKESDGKISSDSVERRYQINLVLMMRENRRPPSFARYKITMNRSQIIDISQSALPDGIASVHEVPLPESATPHQP